MSVIKKYLSVSIARGFSLLEVILSVLIILLLIVPLTGAVINSYGVSSSAGERVQAVFYAQEAMEAAYSVLASRWETIGEGIYHPELIDDPDEVGKQQWTLVSGSGSLGDFTRIINITQAKRDEGSWNLDQGGVSDSNTKRVEVSVTWSTLGKSNKVELISYYSLIGVIYD